MAASTTMQWAPHDYQLLAKQDAYRAMEAELAKLYATAPEDDSAKKTLQKDFEGFKKLFTRFLQEKSPHINWEKIQPLREGAVLPYADINQRELTPEVCSKLLSKLVVLKLNGGLGTSMGCKGPKSLISVRSGLTFLDLTVQQIEELNRRYNSEVPLVLMNSFNTDEDTEKILRKYKSCQVKIFTFNQSRYPRINKESLLPIATDVSESNLEATDVCPSTPPPFLQVVSPGHGDTYKAFAESGLLDQFIKEGKEFVFVSNIDNLGATGGTLVGYEDKLRLLEIAQVHKDHVDEFKSVTKFKFFNTNNLWMKLSAMKRLVDKNELDMEVIVNNKTLADGLGVIQLETAVGAAIKNFDNAIGINVPRSRFLPVKKTSDLLLVMSNLYDMDNGFLDMSAKRQFKTVPLVKLGSHFEKVQEFLRRFENIPDMLELDHLTVSGDVTFGKDVSLKGTVIIVAEHGNRINIPPGAVLENKIVSGNLRILDH
ncbi:UTP--glucose-1-phosphate uridylyltransferase [Branchiostoma belcheri]|nr:UTP--glucose-1-phosphate uridylyltransferase [Branchiostoma belcheri]